LTRPEEAAKSMTSSKVVQLEFSKAAVADWKLDDGKHSNWPVVYVLDNGYGLLRNSGQLKDIYVRESLNAVGRLRQHLDTPAKQHLKNIRVIINERFNKSAALTWSPTLSKCWPATLVTRCSTEIMGLPNQCFQ
jgi:hypothetical protein